MSYLDRINNRHDQIIARTGNRDFPGEQVISDSDRVFGVDTTVFSPPEYGTYIATSNGVYTCVTLRAELLSALPLRLYKVDGPDNRKEVTSGPLFDFIHRVNDFWTMRRLIYMTEITLSLWGVNYWFIQREGSGQTGIPREAWWVRPPLVTPFPHPVNYISHFEIEAVDGGQPQVFLPHEVIWMPKSNPLNEFSGLAPLGAARLAADVASAALKSVRNLYAQGMMAGGMVFPPTGSTFQREDAVAFQDRINDTMTGTEKAHKWVVFLKEYNIKQSDMTFKDAEVLNLLQYSLEDICRPFKIPLDLVGGERTYENIEAAYRAVYTHAIMPEAEFLASEMQEDLLPMFPNNGGADIIEFDFSDVSVLQENKSKAWERASGQIEKGVLLINEWRKKKNMEPVPWGDTWHAPSALRDIQEEPQETAPRLLPASTSKSDTGESSEADAERVAHERDHMSFGSEEHSIAWRRFDRQAKRRQKPIREMLGELFNRQRQSVLDNVRDAEDVNEVAEDPFDTKRWTVEFRTAYTPVLAPIVLDIGQSALDDHGIDQVFDFDNSLIAQTMERRTQRFAVQVNDTTWNQLRASLGEGLELGEGIPKLEARVEKVMGTRIRSSAETISRTEVVSATTETNHIAWAETGVVGQEMWLSALLPNRSRDQHMAMHGQVQEVGQDFIFPDGTPTKGPGLSGVARHDINCFPADTEITLVKDQGIRGATNRHYEGVLIEIATARGYKLAGTPNHPILTNDGWLALSSLIVGNSVISRVLGLQDQSPYPNVEGEGNAIYQIYKLLVQSFALPAKQIVGDNRQFHGDGRDGNVNVVMADEDIDISNVLAINAALAEQIPNQYFDFISSDKIVSVRRFDFSGQVYNLQTVNSWYTANGIVVHNCLCTTSPIVIEGRGNRNGARAVPTKQGQRGHTAEQMVEALRE